VERIDGQGLAVAGRVLQRPDFIDAASAAVDFIRHTLWRDGRLLATYKDGRAHLPAYLDDYAFLADALLELLQSRWRSSDLDFALELVEVLLAKFEDAGNGGFYFTASDPRSAHPSQQDLQRRTRFLPATAWRLRCSANWGTCWPKRVIWVRQSELSKALRR